MSGWVLWWFCLCFLFVCFLFVFFFFFFWGGGGRGVVGRLGKGIFFPQHTIFISPPVYVTLSNLANIYIKPSETNKIEKTLIRLWHGGYKTVFIRDMGSQGDVTSPRGVR